MYGAQQGQPQGAAPGQEGGPEKPEDKKDDKDKKDVEEGQVVN